MRFALFVLTVLLLVSAPAWAQNITGPARVIDSDALHASGPSIRLHGASVPEVLLRMAPPRTRTSSLS